MELGEFVAITGESGSGKSTLLNVLSGLDTYEEGEMYLNGQPTSGYTEKELETYRKQYIGNIFQNFNLVNSYTVYQNIELVLLINGYSKKQIKQKVLEVIQKVDLLKYKNTKVSKLSGGQKQRVAIARALVKETPIIVADEPTGNLDSKSAQSVLELLHEVSKNKLVLIVTHNYEQIEQYVTRKITMHDGRIIEDKIIKEKQQISKEKENNSMIHKMKWKTKFKLGFRNTFNIPSKLLLLFAVYLFLSLAIIGGYSSLQKQEYENSKIGFNNYFRNISDKRLVIKKKTEQSIIEEDYQKILSLSNVNYIVKNDIILDQEIVFLKDDYGIHGSVLEEELFNAEIALGRMPENENEIVLQLPGKDRMMLQIAEMALNSNFTLKGAYDKDVLEEPVKIVGITYEENKDHYGIIGYLSKAKMDEVRKVMNSNYSQMEITFQNHIFNSNSNYGQYRVIPSKEVPKGKAYAFEEFNFFAKNQNCKNKDLSIQVKNQYYEDTLNVKIAKTFNKRNIKSLLKIENYDLYKECFFINEEEYYSLFSKENYQSSIFIKDEKQVQNTITDLENLGYEVLYVKDTLINYMGQTNVIMNAISIVVIGIVLVALFFISYFIIRIILKSRNIYYSTIRMLGATRKDAKQLLKIELFTIFHMVLVSIFILGMLITKEMIVVSFLKDLIEYLHMQDGILLYLVLLAISWLISNRYARQLFKKSAMNTYREEV